MCVFCGRGDEGQAAVNGALRCSYLLSRGTSLPVATVAAEITTHTGTFTGDGREIRRI